MYRTIIIFQRLLFQSIPTFIILFSFHTRLTHSLLLQSHFFFHLIVMSLFLNIFALSPPCNVTVCLTLTLHDSLSIVTIFGVNWVRLMVWLDIFSNANQCIWFLVWLFFLSFFVILFPSCIVNFKVIWLWGLSLLLAD